MVKALFFKEWIKTRGVFLISLIAIAAVSAYAVLMMSRLIQLKGVEHLWLIMLLKDNSFVDTLKYLPAIAGIALAIAQMAPEMAQKRLKLTLHLPYPQNALVAIMLCTGMIELLVIYVLQLAIIGIYDSTILPLELVTRVLLTMVPWCLAGFTAYLFTCSVCLEGTWKRRIILALIGLAVMFIYYLQPALEAYNGMLALIIIFICLTAILSFGSIIRFKEGRQ